MKQIGDDNSVQRIALIAHEAALDASKWSDVVREVAELLDATSAALFTPRLDAGGRMLDRRR